jgi:hypothetical protein
VGRFEFAYGIRYFAWPLYRTAARLRRMAVRRRTSIVREWSQTFFVTFAGPDNQSV